MIAALVRELRESPEALAEVARMLAGSPELRDALRDVVASERLVTVADYARTHAISQSHVRQAITAGRLAYERIGRAVRIPADAVIAPRRKAHTDARTAVRLGLVRGGVR